jgi:glycosyltransferase involved in cell wall biosynthesis
MKKGISVIVPIYNSETTLRELVMRIKKVLDARQGDFELILVNDDSKDSSWKLIEEISKNESWIRGICLMRNYGQHNAVFCGLRVAQYDQVVTLDDDLQNPPEEVPKLLAKLSEGWDVVYGVPEKGQHGLLRNFASRLTKLTLRRAMGINMAGDVSAFRAFRTQLRDASTDFRSPFLSIDVLLSWGTTRFTSMKVAHAPRNAGVSNYNWKNLIIHALNMVTGFSTWPLQVANWLGFFLTFFGVCILVYVVGRYFIQGSSVPGFTFLSAIIAIFSGAQLFALGIIGEYLARVHARISEKPVYTIRKETRQ